MPATSMLPAFNGRRLPDDFERRDRPPAALKKSDPVVMAAATNIQTAVKESVSSRFARAESEAPLLETMSHAELLKAAEEAFERNYDEPVVWAKRDESRYKRAAFNLREFIIGAAEDNHLTSHDQRVISACYNRYFAPEKPTV